MARNFLKMALVLMALSVLCSAAGAVEGERLKLATTTSLQDTGLLDVIKDKFDEKYNVSLDVVSGGTGIAIQYGERGDVDVLIVHDKETGAEIHQGRAGPGEKMHCLQLLLPGRTKG